LKNDPNIRSPEERYGGEGHAGNDPFAGERAGKKDLAPDPSVETPDATVQDLIDLPEPPPDRTETDTNANAPERRSGTERD
jgi:hypothetical protein